MEQHFKTVKTATFNIKKLASLCLTSDEVVQGAGKQASEAQSVWKVCFGNRLQGFWISHNKRKPIPRSHPLYPLLKTQSMQTTNQRAANSTQPTMDGQAAEVQQEFLSL